MTDDIASGPIALCVLGMHRSGTSALARLINLLDVELGDDLLPGSVDNPRGFWEHRQILQAHTDLLDTLGSFFDDYLRLPAGWQDRADMAPHRQRLIDIVTAQFAGKPLWGFKDPRTCRLLPIWHQALAALKTQGRFVLMIRSPDEIAKSLAVRNGYSYNKSLLMTLEHMLQAELHTRGKRRVIVTYDEVLQDWRATASKIADGLGIHWPKSYDEIAAEVAEFLDSGLRHHKQDKAGAAEQAVRLHGADAGAARWVFAVYDLLLAAKETGAPDEAALDRIRAEIDQDAQRLTAWRQIRSTDQKFMQVEAWGQQLDATVKRLARDNQELRLELAARPAAGALTAPDTAGKTAASMADAATREAAIAALEATNHTLRVAAEGAARDMQVFRDAISQRDGLIATLHARVRELELAQQWLATEKAAADKELERRGQEDEKLRAWNQELLTARNWLTSENNRLAEWVKKLEADKAWFAQEQDRRVNEVKSRHDIVPSPGTPGAE